MFKTLSSLLSTFFFFAVIGFVIVISSLWKYAGELPDYHQLEKYEPPVTTRLYAGDGRLLMEYAAEKRFFVPVDKIPEQVKNAFIAAEDKIFIRTAALTMSALSARCSGNIKNIAAAGVPPALDHYPAAGQEACCFLPSFPIPRKIKESDSCHPH